MTINWAAIQSTYAETATDHLSRAQALGLGCPLDLLEQPVH